MLPVVEDPCPLRDRVQIEVAAVVQLEADLPVSRQCDAPRLCVRMPAKTWLAVRTISVISRQPGTVVPTMGAPLSGCGASTMTSMPAQCTSRVIRPDARSMAPGRLRGRQ